MKVLGKRRHRFSHTYSSYLHGMIQVIQKVGEARKAIKVLEYPSGDSGGVLLPTLWSPLTYPQGSFLFIPR